MLISVITLFTLKFNLNQSNLKSESNLNNPGDSALYHVLDKIFSIFILEVFFFLNVVQTVSSIGCLRPSEPAGSPFYQWSLSKILAFLLFPAEGLGGSFSFQPIDNFLWHSAFLSYSFRSIKKGLRNNFPWCSQFRVFMYCKFFNNLSVKQVSVFPLISAPGAYLILELQGAALKRERGLLQSQRNYSLETSKLFSF